MVAPEFSPVIKQAWTVSAVLINMICQGMVLCYPSSLLPALKEPDSPIKADIYTASWLTSSTSLSCIPGLFISSVLMDLHGRKITHALVLLPGIISWVCIYFANGIPALMIGRILGGITTGATATLGAIVIGEYSSPRFRGLFLNLKTASVCLGSMLLHILGNFYTWRTIAMQAIFPHILSLIIVFTWPESPAWLTSIQQFERSEISFFWLRGKSESSTRELEALIKAQMEASSLAKKNLTLKQQVYQFFKKFTKKDFMKPLLIISVSIIVLETCGRHVFPVYGLQIIEEITGNKSYSFYYTVYIDVVITASTIFSSILVKILKRRTLLFTTGFTAFFVMMTVCLYLVLMSRNVISKEYSWISIVMLVVYFILANLGCTSIPLVLLGELYPLVHRSAGSAMSGIVLSLCAVIIFQITPHLLIKVNVHGTFAIYGLVMIINLLILYIMLPETKDRTLQEIENYFNNGKFVNDTVDEDADARVNMIT